MPGRSGLILSYIILIYVRLLTRTASRSFNLKFLLIILSAWVKVPNYPGGNQTDN
ncbi:uncharacterized protein TRIREDRAFT_112369 [Trichoderma reesei QM6a]|uniref:Predicted protein n=1 Tax=Hypocrea jecorina (strain QM6a) TaxID=431241 RepID=G0RWW1_HYPJQ|nr:uncharacterized protein TRIREDRAFT_112369 [Trichoderma reesei QM6a]EGR44297.1 predicted protein [Trichoderma reesei QM6a]